MNIDNIVEYAKTNAWVTWLFHAGIATVIQTVMGILINIFFGGSLVMAFAIGAAAGSFMYYGREKAQHEGDAYAFPGKLDWYLPWKWGKDGFMDWAAPTTAVLLVLFML